MSPLRKVFKLYRISVARLQELLKKICDGEEAIDMERISNLIHRRVLEALNDVSSHFVHLQPYKSLHATCPQ